MIKLTQEIVREFLDYDPETGILSWKERDIKWFNETEGRTAEHACNQWNSKNAHRKAIDCLHDTGYKSGRLFTKYYKAHRIIWLWYYGEWPKNEIDHINGVRSDNRIVNLRDVLPTENMKNTSLLSNNTTGITGVSWYKPKSRWRVRINIDIKKTKHIGYFDNFEDAVKARKEAEIKYGYHENHGKKQ